MAIADEITRLSNAKAALAVSIENKGVPVPSSTKLDGYSALVDQIQQGGGTEYIYVYPNEEKDVSIYDVDGTILASYDFSELSELSAMPEAPSHEGLTFVGWSKSLEEVKALQDPSGVYPRYKVTDDKMHILLEIPSGGATIRLAGIVANSINNSGTIVDPTFTVDWGDGGNAVSATVAGTWTPAASEPEPTDSDYDDYRARHYMSYLTSASSSNIKKHTYSAGSYDCKISCTGLMYTNPGTCTGEPYVNSSPTGFVSSQYVKAIYLPESFAYEQCYIGVNAGANNAERVNMDIQGYIHFRTRNDGYVVVDDDWSNKAFPYNDTYGGSPFRGSNVVGLHLDSTRIRAWCCHRSAIKAVYVASNETMADATGAFAQTKIKGLPAVSDTLIDPYFCYDAVSLEKVTVAEGATSIGAYAFASSGMQYNLKEINLPSTITSIDITAFKYVYANIYLKATTPPTLSDATLCPSVWYVPRSSISSYQNAANWSVLYSSNLILPYDF